MKKANSKRKISRVALYGAVTGALTLLFSFVPPTNTPWVAPPSADKVKNAVATNPQSISAGKTLYNTNCKSCHGAKGKGDGPKSADLDISPKDFTKSEVQNQTDGALFWKISEGRKPMPSFKKDLTDEQRWQVIDYIRTLK